MKIKQILQSQGKAVEKTYINPLGETWFDGYNNGKKMGFNKALNTVNEIEVKEAGVEEIADIVFYNHHGKTLGDCANTVAQALKDRFIILEKGEK